VSHTVHAMFVTGCGFITIPLFSLGAWRFAL
jgi:hypothetical protein